jgi:hypothetical protein
LDPNSIEPADPDLGRLNLFSEKGKKENFMPEEPEHKFVEVEKCAHAGFQSKKFPISNF